MGKLCVGLDLVQISQVMASIDRFGTRYLESVFTEKEIRYCSAFGPAAAEHYAARFAAKEATLKVLRPGDEAVSLRSIEVVRGSDGHCEIVLHGAALQAAERQSLAVIALSLSHEADMAAAVVIAQKIDDAAR
jgi:holo-[acyl-carrier protein] synthase